MAHRSDRGQTTLVILAICLGVWPLNAQVLLLDRKSPDPLLPSTSLQFSPKQPPGFWADRFSVGEKNQLWVIDRLTTWGHPEGGGNPMGYRFDRIALLGGLEAKPLAPGEFDCDCHNLIPLQSATLQKGTDTAEGGNVKVSRQGPHGWQLDFEHLNWSVPGGVEIQFGIALTPSGGNGSQFTGWIPYMVRTGTQHEIRLFDPKGRLVGPDSALKDHTQGFAIQVWGHVPATIGILPRGALWEVTLETTPTFEAAGVDPSSLHFGPGGATPVEFHAKGAALVMTFRSSDAGAQAGDLNACLKGRRRDGVPFEGCGLLRAAQR